MSYFVENTIFSYTTTKWVEFILKVIGIVVFVSVGNITTLLSSSWQKAPKHLYLEKVM